MFMGPRNWFQRMNSASLWSLAGRYDKPIPPRFLAPIDFLKIPALPPWKNKYGVQCTVYTSCILFDCYPRLNCLRSVPNSPLLDTLLYKKSDLCASIHRLNMKLDLQSLFGLRYIAVLIGWDAATPPLPTHLGSCTRALLVSQDRRHLFVTPCFHPFLHS